MGCHSIEVHEHQWGLRRVFLDRMAGQEIFPTSLDFVILSPQRLILDFCSLACFLVSVMLTTTTLPLYCLRGFIIMCLFTILLRLCSLVEVRVMGQKAGVGSSTDRFLAAVLLRLSHF